MPQRYETSDPQDAPATWDVVMSGLEHDILNRHDIVGGNRHQYVGRGGDAGFRWKKLEWRPPRRKVRRSQGCRAWEAVIRRGKHVVTTHGTSSARRRGRQQMVTQAFVIMLLRRVWSFCIFICTFAAVRLE